MVHKKCSWLMRRKTTTCQEVPSETNAHNTIIRLSAGHNPFTHVEHVVQDVEWNIDCAKPVVVWH